MYRIKISKNLVELIAIYFHSGKQMPPTKQKTNLSPRIVFSNSGSLNKSYVVRNRPVPILGPLGCDISLENSSVS